MTIAYAIDLTADGAIAALGRIGAAADMALGFIQGLGQGILDLSAAGAARSAEMAKLSEMVNRNSVSAEAAAKNFDAFAQAVDKLEVAGFAREDAINSLGDYVAMTGEAASATKDLELAAGIATMTSQTLEEATLEVARARQGDIGALKELGVVTDDQLKKLEATKDESKRTALAMKILEERFSGVAMQSATATQSVAVLSQSKDRLFAKIGQVINQSGALQAVLGPLNDLFLEASEYIDDNSVKLQHLVLDGMMYAVAGADAVIEVLTFLAQSFADLELGIDLIIAGSKLFASTIELELRRAARTAGEQVQDLSASFRTLLENARAGAKALGATGQVEMFDKALGQLDEADAKIQKMIDSNAEQGKAAAEAVNEAHEEVRQAFVERKKMGEEINKFRDKASKVVDETRKNLAKQRQNVKAIEDHTKKTKDNTDGIKDNTKETAKAFAEIAEAQGIIGQAISQAADTARADAIAERRLAALNEETELQRELAMLEVDRMEVRADKGLTASQEALELKRLEMEETELLAAEEERRAEALERLTQEREKERAERRRADAERLNNQFGMAEDAIKRVGDAAESDAAEGMAELTNIALGTTQQFLALRDAGKGAVEATGAAAAGAAGLAGGAIASMIDDTKDAAAIRAAFAAAESVLYFATGNIPAGIGAAVAAAQYTAVATGAIGGGNGGGGGGAAANRAQAVNRGSGASTATATARARSNRSFVEDSARGGGQGEMVIQMNFRDTRVMSDDPKFMASLFDGVEREGRRRGIRFQRPGRTG